VVRWSSGRVTMPLRAKVTNSAFAGKAQVSEAVYVVSDILLIYGTDGYRFTVTTQRKHRGH
jgi:hypothetical protein